MTAPQTTGRPRGFDEERVLDAALDLFWRNGYRATTTRDLEATLGLSQSSIYNAYGSKRGLLVTALERYEHRIDAALVAPLLASEAGLAAISEFFDALARWITRDGKRGCMIINLMAEDGGETDEITERTRSYRSQVRAALNESLHRAAQSGETAPGSIEERTDLLYGMVLALNIAARGGGSSQEVAQLVAGAHHVVASWAAA